ncbi:MAG: response regulator [Bacteroidales bacterium]
MDTKKCIFFVEDNEFFASTVSNGLKNRMKCDVEVFHTGEDMLAQLDKTPDVIILDYQLDSTVPNAKNGAEILRIALQKYPGLNVIMLTSMEDLKEAVNLLKKGAVDYILKDDVFFENLIKSISNVFEIQELKNEITDLRKKNKAYRKRLVLIFLLMITIVTVLGLILL